MFETLSDKLQRVFKNLRGEGRLTEQHIEEALKEIRMALLEADVNFKVVKQFTDSVKAKAVGQEVLQSLSPGQQVVKIVRDELVEILGGSNVRVNFASQPPTVLMLVGLQGSGKTTSSGKLAKWMEKNGHRPMLVSVDVYRPAASRSAEGHCEGNWNQDLGRRFRRQTVAALRRGFERARNTAHDVLIIDTAGRLHIDEALMKELREIKDTIKPERDSVCCRCDARSGRGEKRGAVPRATRLQWFHPYQDGRRRARWRGLVDQTGNWTTREVRRYR
jgi:signal recognition particle subunit SRP54